MLRKLRLRFIVIATACTSLFILIFAAALNVLIYTQTENNIRTVLSVMTANSGELPITTDVEQDLVNQNIQAGSIYNFQYFSATTDGNDITVNLGNSQSLNDTVALDMIRSSLDTNDEFGTVRYNNRYFSYQLTTTSKNKRLLVFLETTSYYRERSNLLGTTLWALTGGFVFLVLIISLLSGMAIRPYIRNYEKQRMFITNAGHELKTPLAIISANTELQELMEGESEWSKSTKDQTERLSQLIARLIRLSRLEEQEEVQTSQQELSPILDKVSQAMTPLMQQKGLTYQRDIQPDLEAIIAYDEAYELFSILLDNAQKYCDDKGTVTITAQQVRHRLRKRVLVEVSNSYANGENVDYKRFFDRFYRAETSHNNQTVSGYGIGLSMAQHLTELFGGRLSVSYKNQMITFSVLL